MAKSVSPEPAAQPVTAQRPPGAPHPGGSPQLVVWLGVPARLFGKSDREDPVEGGAKVVEPTLPIGRAIAPLPPGPTTPSDTLWFAVAVTGAARGSLRSDEGAKG